jgi:uncharacterized protein YigE (DUF2233 family)
MLAAARQTRASAFLGLLIAGACVLPEPAAAGPPCRAVKHEDNAYTVCEVDLRKQAIRLFWKRSDGTPYGYLSSLPRSLEKPSDRLLFAINAGMFDPAYKPVGLYVENGQELVRANTKSGWGNFHLKPNGIFYVAGESAGVVETGAYLKQSIRPDIATQSGPMLVINARLHPRFVHAKVSLKQRTGVGVRDSRTVVFAISDSSVSFDGFARFFRDAMKCNDALFLDGGSVSTLYVPSQSRGSNLFSLGPMIGVFEKTRP